MNRIQKYSILVPDTQGNDYNPNEGKNQFSYQRQNQPDWIE